MIECTISGNSLRAHRARGLTLSFRALGAVLPIVLVASVNWRQEFLALILICGVLALGAAYSVWRWLKEMALPADERFVLEDDTLMRFVGGEETGRVPHASLKGAFRSGEGIAVHGEGSIVIPGSCEGFESMQKGLSTWGDVQTTGSTAVDIAARFGVRGIFMLMLLTGALIYLSYESGTWLWFLAATVLGFTSAELLGRFAIHRAERNRPIAF